MKLVEDCQNRRRKVSYRKQIAREHSYHQNYGQARSVVDPVFFSSHLLVWSQCKISLLFLVVCSRMCRKYQKLGNDGNAPCDGGVPNPLETCFSHAWYHAKFGHSGSVNASVITEIRKKNLTPRRISLSRSHKVIGTDTDPSATYDFLLEIHSNHGPISYRFRHKRRFWVENSKFFHPCVFSALAEGLLPLEYGNGGRWNDTIYNVHKTFPFIFRITLWKINRF